MPQTLRMVLNDWRADCLQRPCDLHQRAVYKYGDFVENAVAFLLSAVVCTAMV